MKKNNVISTPAKEMVEEHEQLVDVLQSGDKAKLKAETKKQKKELKEYKEKMNKGYFDDEDGKPNKPIIVPQQPVKEFPKLGAQPKISNKPAKLVKPINNRSEPMIPTNNGQPMVTDIEYLNATNPYTKSGKSIPYNMDPEAFKDWTSQDHLDAASHYYDRLGGVKDVEAKKALQSMWKQHTQMADRFNNSKLKKASITEKSDDSIINKDKKIKKGVKQMPDGQVKRFPGKEELVKTPREIWARLKKALNNESIVDWEKEGKKDLAEEQQAMMQGQQQQVAQPDPQQQQGSQDASVQEPNQENSSQAQLAAQSTQQNELPPQQEQGQPSPIAEQQPGNEPMSEQNVQEMGQNGNAQGQDIEQEAQQDLQQLQQQNPEASEEELMQELAAALKAEGHSDAEIAYVVHGITLPGVDYKGKTDKEVGENKVNHEKTLSQIKLEHEKRMKDMEHEHAHKKGDPTHEVEHKKALFALELKAKEIEIEKQKLLHELEVESKKKEIEQKLRHQEEMHKHKLNSVSSKD